MHSHTQRYSRITLAVPHLHASMREALRRTCIHVFSMKRTGRTIMVSGRNGVRFPSGPAATWWAKGLEVGPGVCVCVYLHMGMPEWECVWDWVVFTVMWVEGAGTHPAWGTEGWLCGRQSGLDGSSGSGEKVGQNVSLKAAPWQVAERPLSHYILPHLSKQSHHRYNHTEINTLLIVCVYTELPASITNALKTIMFGSLVAQTEKYQKLSLASVM